METTDQFRATSWDEYIGQEELKRTLQIHIAASQADNRRMLHTLLVTEPGFGKTTLANIIAVESDTEIMELTMPIATGTLISHLRAWNGGTLFLDEIHRATKAQQEDLLPALNEGYLQTKYGEKVYIPHVTIIGATTEPDKVIAPLFDRFELMPGFAPYSDDELKLIVQGMGHKINIDFTDETAKRLGRASGGVPRIAGKIVLAARALADTGNPVTVEEILRLAGRDEDGLDHRHIQYLEALMNLGGTAGAEKIANHIRLPRSTVLNLERLLIDRGLIYLGVKGRELRGPGYDKVKKSKPKKEKKKSAPKQRNMVTI